MVYSGPIFKILRQVDANGLPLEKYDPTWEWKGATIDLQDGFIHLSKTDQVEGVLHRFFEDEDSVTILKFASLPESLITWESPKHSETTEVFPHVYGGMKWDVLSQAEHIIVEKHEGAWPTGDELKKQLLE